MIDDSGAEYAEQVSNRIHAYSIAFHCSINEVTFVTI